MKKFILVFEGQVVQRYESDKQKVFGGPWAEGETFEVPEGISLERAELIEGEVVEKGLTEDEAFEKELRESESYLSQIQKGQQAIALYRLLNDKKNLTKAQKKTALGNTAIQEIIQHLLLGRLPDAIEAIEALPADGKIVTELDKAKLIKLLGV